MFPQLAPQVLQKSPQDLRCSARAWKVTLEGEGADDAGGVFDETMTQMCEVRKLESLCTVVKGYCKVHITRFLKIYLHPVKIISGLP